MRGSGKNDNRPAATAEDRLKYQKEWEKMMVTIWREKIMRLHVVDTTSLHREITGNTLSSGTDLATIQHKFMGFFRTAEPGVDTLKGMEVICHFLIHV